MLLTVQICFTSVVSVVHVGLENVYAVMHFNPVALQTNAVFAIFATVIGCQVSGVGVFLPKPCMKPETNILYNY
jgi:hypothetical protein